MSGVMCWTCYCRYIGPFMDEAVLHGALEDGLLSPDFMKFMVWITSEIAKFANINEYMSPYSGRIFTMQRLLKFCR